MSTILRVDGPHLGGLAALFFVPVAALPTLPDVAADEVTLLGDLVLTAPATWSQLQGTLYTPALDVEASGGVHGQGYAHKLTGWLPGDQPEAAASFRRMQGRRFVLLYRDYDGRVRLVGDPGAGLLFSHKQTSATKPGERKGYAWSFEGTTPNPSRYYAGVRPPELEAPPTAAPGAGTGAPVLLRTAGGRLLATVPPGSTITLASAFAVNFQITP